MYQPEMIFVSNFLEMSW